MLLSVDALAFLLTRSVLHFLRLEGPLAAVGDIFPSGYLGGLPFAVALFTPGSPIDGVIDGATGGTIEDIEGSGTTFQVEPGVLPDGDTNVIIEVLPDPGPNIPPGFVGFGTLLVDITLDPNPSPLPLPGATITLPLGPDSTLLPGDPVALFTLFNNILAFGGIWGSVDPSGTTASFSGILHFSAFVGLELGEDIFLDGFESNDSSAESDPQ